MNYEVRQKSHRVDCGRSPHALIEYHMIQIPIRGQLHNNIILYYRPYGAQSWNM